jgi:hypothetical protein
MSTTTAEKAERILGEILRTLMPNRLISTDSEVTATRRGDGLVHIAWDRELLKHPDGEVIVDRDRYEPICYPGSITVKIVGQAGWMKGSR